MSEGKQSEAWNHTASVIAILVKLKLGKKGRRIKAKQFHPFAGKSGKRRLSNEESRRRLHEFTRHYAKRKSPTIRQSGDRAVAAEGGRGEATANP